LLFIVILIILAKDNLFLTLIKCSNI